MRNKQRGQANPGAAIFIGLVVIAIIVIVALGMKDSPSTSKHHAQRGHQITAKGEFLKPTADGHGRYAYRADDNNWYIYYWLMTSNSNNNYYNGGSYTPLSGLPSGGSWQKAEVEPTKEEVVAEQEEPVAEANTGTPETEQEYQTENQDGVENQSVEPENTTEPSTSEPSAPSESAPSDSGSGGDSGGDSGGGGDGGGGDGGARLLTQNMLRVA